LTFFFKKTKHQYTESNNEKNWRLFIVFTIAVLIATSSHSGSPASNASFRIIAIRLALSFGLCHVPFAARVGFTNCNSCANDPNFCVMKLDAISQTKCCDVWH
jgi:hypothetical protein